MTQAMGNDSAEALIGRVFDGRYRIERVLGRGGMGVVYVAEQLSMAKQVALKVLPRHLSEDPSQVQRFNHEALASSHLRHPHTIRVFDYGKSEDGHLYIAMELLQGEVLSRIIRRERGLPAERVVHIARQVVKSIGEAHQAGLVHRDLKPDNIFLCDFFGEKDYVKVLDFGIAKFTEGGGTDQAHTATGFIAGTPLYIAPEQALGEPVAPRSDLYALGAILFECLVGSPPFRADTPIAIVMKQIHEAPPPLRSVKADVQVPPELEALVFQLLRKRPSDRPATAEEVGGVLDRISQGLAGQAAGRRFKSVLDSGVDEVTIVTGSGTAIPALDGGFSDTPSRGTATMAASVAADDDTVHERTQALALRRRHTGTGPPELPVGHGGALAPGLTTERPGSTVSPAGGLAVPSFLEPPKSSPWAIGAAVAALVVILSAGGFALWSALGVGDEAGADVEAVTAGLSPEAANSEAAPSESEAVAAAVAPAVEPEQAEAVAPPAEPQEPATEATPSADPAPAPVADEPAVEIPLDALVEVRSKPAGAEVLAGKESLGRTPIAVTVQSGETRELTLRFDGYTEASLKVDGESEEAGVDVTLTAIEEPKPAAKPRSGSSKSSDKPKAPATATKPEKSEKAEKVEKAPEPEPKPRKGKIEWQDF
ncbi:MAG: protein kinase [Myxococcota bacterium]